MIRGLPASGKITMAKDLTNERCEYLEANMHFDVDNNYQYDTSRIRDTHSGFQQMTRQALVLGNRVVVGNH